MDSESRVVLDGRTVAPPATTTFTIEGGYNPPPFLFMERKTATMVLAAPPTSAPLNFLFACTGATPGWRQFDFNSEPMATEHVRIAGVRNVGGHTIVIDRTDSEQVLLRPGEVTDRLNGKVDGVWRASISPLDPASLSRPRCGPTEVSNPWPDLPVELMFICVAD